MTSLQHEKCHWSVCESFKGGPHLQHVAPIAIAAERGMASPSPLPPHTHTHTSSLNLLPPPSPAPHPARATVSQALQPERGLSVCCSSCFRTWQLPNGYATSSRPRTREGGAGSLHELSRPAHAHSLQSSQSPSLVAFVVQPPRRLLASQVPS
eukprot:359199-Chlamydomonas_euryale.AAC.2